MNKVSEISLEDDSVIDHCVKKLGPFLDSTPGDYHTQLKSHAAWYNDEDHTMVSMMKVNNIRFCLGARKLTQLYLMMSTLVYVCGEWLDCGTQVHGLWQRHLCAEQFLPLMTNVTAGCYGMVEGCVIVSIDSS